MQRIIKFGNEVVPITFPISLKEKCQEILGGQRYEYLTGVTVSNNVKQINTNV